MIWTTAYSGINCSNIVIAKAPEIEMDEARLPCTWLKPKVLKSFYYNIL